MIRLKLTVHFQARLYERNIDIDHIKRAIERPDTKTESFDKIIVTKKVGEKTIVVVYLEQGFRDKQSEYIVVTSYYLDK